MALQLTLIDRNPFLPCSTCVQFKFGTSPLTYLTKIHILEGWGVVMVSLYRVAQFYTCTNQIQDSFTECKDKVANQNSRSKVKVYVSFCSQGHIGTGPQHLPLFVGVETHTERQPVIRCQTCKLTQPPRTSWTKIPMHIKTDCTEQCESALTEICGSHVRLSVSLKIEKKMTQKE